MGTSKLTAPLRPSPQDHHLTRSNNQSTIIFITSRMANQNFRASNLLHSAAASNMSLRSNNNNNDNGDLLRHSSCLHKMPPTYCQDRLTPPSRSSTPNANKNEKMTPRRRYNIISPRVLVGPKSRPTAIRENVITFGQYSSNIGRSSKRIIDDRAATRATYSSTHSQKLTMTICCLLLLAITTTITICAARNEEYVLELNSENFATQIMQPKPKSTTTTLMLPHLSVCKFYTSYCGYCRKFSPYYAEFGRNIRAWRAVIRPVSIDLAVANNVPISRDWDIVHVPTVRAFAPLAVVLSADNVVVDDDYVIISDVDKYRNAMGGELRPSHYNLSKYIDKSTSVALLRQHTVLSVYELVQRQRGGGGAILRQQDNKGLQTRTSGVSGSSSDSGWPAHWPSFEPIERECSLSELRAQQRAHRSELMLLLIGGTSERHAHLLGIETLLELSSGGAHQSTVYAAAVTNRALLEDVASRLASLPLASTWQAPVRSVLDSIAGAEQSGARTSDNVDDSSMSSGGAGNNEWPPTLVVHYDVEGDTIMGAVELHELVRVSRRDTLGENSLIHALTAHIARTYTETSGDREFVEQLDAYDRQLAEQNKQQLNSNHNNNQRNNNNDNNQAANSPKSLEKEKNTFDAKIDEFLAANTWQQASLSTSTQSNDQDDLDKALRYMWFVEVQRAAPTTNVTLQRERLDALRSLAHVLVAYYPFGDTKALKFMHSVRAYLDKQHQEADSNADNGVTVFDVRRLKAHMKELPASTRDARLRDPRSYRHCDGDEHGYSCALWRLFHTLTALELRKQRLLLTSHTLLVPTDNNNIVNVDSTDKRQQQMSDADNQANAVEPTSTSIVAQAMGGQSQQQQEQIVRVVSEAPPAPSSHSLTVQQQQQQQLAQATLGEGPNKQSDNASSSAVAPPVLMAMRDYVRLFFGCTECAQHFESQSSSLSTASIRQAPPEFSTLWLWRTHNRVTRRVALESARQTGAGTQASPRRTIFPTYEQCSQCYFAKPTSDPMSMATGSLSITHTDNTDAAQSPPVDDPQVQWNEAQIVEFLLNEYANTHDAAWQQAHRARNNQHLALRYDNVWLLLIMCLAGAVALPSACYALISIARHRRNAKLSQLRQEFHIHSLHAANGHHYTNVDERHQSQQSAG